MNVVWLVKPIYCIYWFRLSKSYPTWIKLLTNVLFWRVAELNGQDRWVQERHLYATLATKTQTQTSWGALSSEWDSTTLLVYPFPMTRSCDAKNFQSYGIEIRHFRGIFYVHWAVVYIYVSSNQSELGCPKIVLVWHMYCGNM